jgi:hypothetical protein
VSSSILSGLIGGLAAVAIVTYISTKARAQAQRGSLRYGAWLVVLAWCCAAFVAVAVWALYNDLDVWQDRGELFAVVGIIVGFGSGAAYCFAEYFGTHGTYDDDGIDFHTPWSGWKRERWRDLGAVEFNAQASWYVLTFRSGQKVRISSLLGGHGGVLVVLEQRGFPLGAGAP